jgi:DNA recombination protein RmuC
MVENCDFTEQAHVAAESGNLRPDVIVHLPGNKTTVIDAKVPLLAYLDAIEADDEPRRRQHLRAHANQLRTHVTQLGSRSYWDQLASSPDFVVMYVPIESAFTAALQADPDLIDYAVNCRVIPCGPMTLLTHLKSAAYGWRQERIALNAQQISDLGKQLYERLATFANHLDELGKHLGQATDAYNHAVGSVEHRVLTAARRFKELGATSGDDLPQLEAIGSRPRPLTSPELRQPAEPRQPSKPDALEQLV